MSTCLGSKSYLKRVHENAKPIEQTFEIGYKFPPTLYLDLYQYLNYFTVKHLSNHPKLVQIGCCLFGIEDFLLVAKRDGYWGEYHVYKSVDTKSFPQYKVSIEDYERVVAFVTDIYYTLPMTHLF